MLKLAEVTGLDLDDPETTLAHRRVLLSKPFLRSLYEDWYEEFHRLTPHVAGSLLEIGSGGGFLQQVIPDVITSDIMDLPHVDRVFSAEKIPFEDESLRAVYMLNTFHHIPNSRRCLSEIERTLTVGGRLICIEPTNTLLSRFIYKNIHHEPFELDGRYELQPGRPLSHSNQALPWMVFARDWNTIGRDFPCLRVASLRNHTPLRFLLSGGLSYRAFVPSSTYSLVKRVENAFPSWLTALTAMFMTVVVEKHRPANISG